MKHLLVRLAVAGALAVPFVAGATQITGSDSIALFNVATNPANASFFPISGITSISNGGAVISSTGTGNFSIIPTGTFVSVATFFPNGPNGGTIGTPFTFTISGFGTFTETSNPVVLANASNGTSSGTNIFLVGTFTPSGALSGFQSNTASFDISFTRTGASDSGSGTLAVPAATVIPEPSSIVLLGSALLAGAGVMRKRLLA